jgi:hypothetical protein
MVPMLKRREASLTPSEDASKSLADAARWRPNVYQFTEPIADIV